MYNTGIKMHPIELENIRKSFNNVHAVNNLSLKVTGGEIFGFLGTNGAGKTTTIKMLLGLIKPDDGKLSLFGKDAHDISTKKRIGFMPETAYYYPFLKAHELIAFYGELCGMDKKTIKTRTEELLVEVGLENTGKKTLKTFSKGMLQRVGIAQALLHDPDLFILDEPFTGLDPLAKIHFRDLILKLKKRGKTVFFSSHELSEAELICDRVAILKEGSSVYDGPVTEIAGDGKSNLERIFLHVLKDKKSEDINKQMEAGK